jgi:CRP-like cAMP-binding protein
VVQLLRPGDVGFDIQLLLEMPLPYAGRAMSEVTCLFLGREDFEELLAARPGIARRWLSSVAQRLAASQARILALLGGSLAAQAAGLLAEEAVDGRWNCRRLTDQGAQLVEVLPAAAVRRRPGCPGGTLPRRTRTCPRG